MSVSHDDRIDEMFVQVAGIFAESILQRTADADVIDHGQVLHIFAKSDASCVRANRNVEFGGEEQNGKNFVHATDSTAIDLTDSDRS